MSKETEGLSDQMVANGKKKKRKGARAIQASSSM